MPSYLPLKVIQSMTYPELQRWWEVDFEVLMSTAVAEATDSVHPSVREALQSEDWLEQWADALYAASGELKSSVERMEYFRDQRLRWTREKAGQVEKRRGEVNRMLRDQKSAQGWELFPEHLKNAEGISMSILAGHHSEEIDALIDEECARRGIAPKSPFWGKAYADKWDSVEDAVRLQLIQAPLTDEAKELLRMKLDQLTHLVAKDVTQQEERLDGLRHPLILRRWLQCLEHLRDRHCELAGLEPRFNVALPRLDMQELSRLPEEKARQIINRRRFIRALAQRARECEMHTRQTVRAVAARREEAELPWYEARRAARIELARRHPLQYQALLKAFEPFCEPGTKQIQRDVLRKRNAFKLPIIPELKKALADGTWRHLLDD